MTSSAVLSQMSAGRLRAEALAAARRFKNTWIEFGAVLIQVRSRMSWREWGFDSFEAYCAKELHIRQKTAQKLTASYGFLMKHEPEIAASESRFGSEPSEAREADDMAADESAGSPLHLRPGRNMPAFQTISVLADAEENGRLSDDDYASLRERIWGEGAASPELAREICERFAAPKAPHVRRKALECVFTFLIIVSHALIVLSLRKKLKRGFAVDAQLQARNFTSFISQLGLNSPSRNFSTMSSKVV